MSLTPHKKPSSHAGTPLRAARKASWRSTLRSAALLGASAALALGLAACGTRATTATTTAATTVRPTTIATTTAITPSSVAATQTAKPTTATTRATTTSPTTTILLTEPQLAYIVSVSDGTPASVQVDYVDMYFGEEAVAKALADKSPVVETDEKGNSYIANDYYLRNTNPQLRTFKLAAKCEIRVLPEDGGSDPTDSITAVELRAQLRRRKLLMEITFSPSGTEIAELTEFFVP